MRSGPARDAIRKYDGEVEAEMARLIEEGEAPWDAAAKAGDIVRSRRRAERYGKRVAAAMAWFTERRAREDGRDG